jgi:hypothetical protein
MQRDSSFLVFMAFSRDAFLLMPPMYVGGEPTYRVVNILVYLVAVTK